MRLVLFLLGTVLVSTAVAKLASSGDEILALAQHRSTKMTKITSAPHKIDRNALSGCAIDALLQGGDNANVIQPDKFYHIYITNPDAKILQKGRGVYPEGTVVLKEKLSDEKGKTTELFTGMVKREKGFNPDGGDWEYFVLSADAKKIMQRGKIESCMNCHDSYQETDYITRVYMPNHP